MADNERYSRDQQPWQYSRQPSQSSRDRPSQPLYQTPTVTYDNIQQQSQPPMPYSRVYIDQYGWQMPSYTYNEQPQPPVRDQSYEYHGSGQPPEAYGGSPSNPNFPQPVSSGHYDFNQDGEIVRTVTYKKHPDPVPIQSYDSGRYRHPTQSSVQPEAHYRPSVGPYDNQPETSFYVRPGGQKQQQVFSPDGNDSKQRSTNEKKEWKEELKKVRPSSTDKKLDDEWSKEIKYRKFRNLYNNNKRLNNGQKRFMKNYERARDARYKENK